MLLGTRVGGRVEDPGQPKRRRAGEDGDAIGHHANSTDAMSWVEKAWGQAAQPDGGADHDPAADSDAVPSEATIRPTRRERAAGTPSQRGPRSGMAGERILVRSDAHLKEVLQAAAKSRRQEFTPGKISSRPDQSAPAAVEIRHRPEAAALDTWLEEQRKGLTPTQADFLEN